MPLSDRTLPSVLGALQHQRLAVLTTLDGRRPVSRPMRVQGPDEDGFLWVATRSDTEKVAQLRFNNRVSLSYADGAYLLVVGTAEVVRSPSKARELWSPSLQRWLRCLAEDPRVALIRVMPEVIGYWESPQELRTVFLLGKDFVRNIEPPAPRLRMVPA